LLLVGWLLFFGSVFLEVFCVFCVCVCVIVVIGTTITTITTITQGYLYEDC
jgi:hypothetical protein